MEITPFQTERFFGKYEFTAPYLLCASDCETITVDELLRMAGESWEAMAELRLGYSESQGAPTLRERVAEQYQDVDPQEVITLGAPEEGIFITFHALLEPGDEVVVISPCYDSLHNLGQHLGCQVHRWQLVEAQETSAAAGWSLDIEALEQLLRRQPRLVVVNFPHNPTGVLPSLQEWQEIVRLVEQSGAWLFSDEMYRGLEYDPKSRLPSGCESGERIITLAGLSKAFGLPGLRSGWLVARDRQLHDRIMGWKDYTTICASAPSELLAEVALVAADELMQRCRGIVLDNLRYAEAFFRQWSELLRWNRPRAGSVALPGLHGDRSATALSQAALDSHGVLLLPGTCLGADDLHFRIGLGRKSFVSCLEQLGSFLEGYQ
jgi:aspartate/methionine/tyrosine aminotransferase